MVDQCDVMVVCNPNNPTGARVAPAILRDWAQRLALRGGWLVVDEAFGDTTPDLSVAALTGTLDGLIVLRSVGKFFGLAGLRLGFVAAQPALLAALLDTTWQASMRQQLLAGGERLHGLLATHGINASGSAMYQWWPQPQAAVLHDWMARRGIWLRLFTSGAGGLRSGLPPDEAGWQRLQTALQDWQRQTPAIQTASQT
jgi:cobalamin biosynthetic protein CobC